jgi:uncharacterized membrane protein YkoI
MKRNITVAAIAAAVLIGGGGYTAFATGDSGSGTTPTASRSATHDATDDHGGDRPTAGTPSMRPTTRSTAGLTSSEAVAAALKKYPGTLSSIEREGKGSWEVKVLGRDGLRHELHINALTGTVRLDDHGGDRARTHASPTARPRIDDHPHDAGDDHGGDRGHDAGDDHGGDRHGGGSRHGGDDG